MRGGVLGFVQQHTVVAPIQRVAQKSIGFALRLVLFALVSSKRDTDMQEDFIADWLSVQRSIVVFGVQTFKEKKHFLGCNVR